MAWYPSGQIEQGLENPDTTSKQLGVTLPNPPIGARDDGPPSARAPTTDTPGRRITPSKECK